MIFYLKGPAVSGKNQIGTAFVNGKVIRFPNARFKEWRDNMARQILKQRKPTDATFTKPIRLWVNYFPHDKRRRDATGMIDAIFHLLEYTRIIADDSLVKELSWIEASYKPEFKEAIISLVLEER